MELNIEIVEKNLRRFVFGEAAPAYLEPEFNTLLVAIAMADPMNALRCFRAMAKAQGP